MRRTKLHSIYKNTRKLIENEERWIKGAYELDGKFCLLGALRHTAKIGESTSPMKTSLALKLPLLECINQLFPDRHHHYENIVWFNDNHKTTHKDVLAVLDCAIKDSAPKEKS